MADVFPRQLAEAVKQGYNRLRSTRKTRAMYVQQYVGQYYHKTYGTTGQEPLNLIYHTIRSQVPQLVTRNPTVLVSSPIVAHQDYAFLLGLALNELSSKQHLDIKGLMRYAIVDALFTMGILKTGISSSDSLTDFGNIKIDKGMIFTENVSMDDFVIDSECKSLETASFVGDRIRVPRQLLLDSDTYDHDMVMKLPKSGSPQVNEQVKKLSQQGLSDAEIAELQDHVDVVSVYVPGAEAIVTIADPAVCIKDEFLSIQDYYGPKGGPYTYLKMSQPVPDNPLPIAPIGVWYDLHMMANDVARKSLESISKQKTVIGYDPSNADEAHDMQQASDGDMVACDPSTITAISTGGETAKDSIGMLSQIQYWANFMGGNPDQAAGNKSGASTATEASILQSNSSIAIADSIDTIYECAGEIQRKHAWYMHHDPQLNVPVPWRRPSTGEQVQLVLTPEERQGRHEDYMFRIKPKSMTATDPQVQAKRVLEFGINIMPSMATTAQIMMQMGYEFNLPKALTDVGEKLGVDEDVRMWFNDPEFERRMMLLQAMGPQPTGKAGEGQASQAGIMQNNGIPMNQPGTTMAQDQNAASQAGANPGQSMMQGVY